MEPVTPSNHRRQEQWAAGTAQPTGACTALEPTTLFTRFGKYEIWQLHIILPKCRCVQLQRSLPERKQQKDGCDRKKEGFNGN